MVSQASAEREPEHLCGGRQRAKALDPAGAKPAGPVEQLTDEEQDLLEAFRGESPAGFLLQYVHNHYVAPTTPRDVAMFLDVLRGIRRGAPDLFDAFVNVLRDRAALEAFDHA